MHLSSRSGLAGLVGVALLSVPVVMVGDAALADAALADAALADGALADAAFAETPNVRAAEEALKAHVLFLSDSRLEGRGTGSPGLEDAARYIEQQFQGWALEPAGESTTDGGWRQRISEGASDANVLARLKGTGAQPGCVVLGAHYDHLGKDEKGVVFPGADDNASGVAVLLEVARALGEAAEQDPQSRPARDILFVAFAGEETGLKGSRAYVARPVCALEQTLAMVNLDVVGRVQDRKLLAIGAGSAAEWESMLRGVGMAAGLEVTALQAGPFASDQVPFYERGIPSVHFFGGPNADYHRASDTPDKLDYAALASVRDLVQELTLYLANRPGKLTFVPPGAADAKPQSSATAAPRRVSLGTIPDFAQEKGGVLLAGVTPGSPAEAAGFQKGDVLVELGGESIDTLADFTDVLKQHAPGDEVVVVVLREGQKLSKTVQLAERK